MAARLLTVAIVALSALETNAAPYWTGSSDPDTKRSAEAAPFWPEWNSFGKEKREAAPFWPEWNSFGKEKREAAPFWPEWNSFGKSKKTKRFWPDWHSFGDTGFEKRDSQSGNSVQYANGAFGFSGLFGSIQTNGQAVQSATGGAAIYQDTVTQSDYCLKHICPWQFWIFGTLFGGTFWGNEQRVFDNSNAQNWPTSRPDGSKWAVRTFTDSYCGSYGQNPSKTQISEYHGADFGYMNGQPCQNYMISSNGGKSRAKSTAVWIAAGVENAYITAFSSATCQVDERMEPGSANWTNAFTEHGAKQAKPNFQNYASIYNGLGLVIGHGSDVQEGAWVCLPNSYNAFSVLQVGTASTPGTNMQVPSTYYDSKGNIPLQNTVPANLDQTKAFFQQQGLFTTSTTQLPTSS